MTEKTKFAFFAIIATSLFVLGQTAYATQPIDVSGDFSVTILGIPTFEQHGKQCTITLPAQFSLTGDLQGLFSSDFKIIHFGNCFEPARENFKTSGTFDGIVNGNSGTFDFTFQGKIDENSIAQGNLIIQKGTGGLANLHGMIELTGLSGVGGSYQGQIHFDS